MANIINAITTGAGGLSTTADTSGNINFQSNGSTVASITSSGLAVTGNLTVNGASPGRSGSAYATLSSGTPNITLTSSSNQVQIVTADAEGQSITLPDATTMTKGAGFFVFYNTSSYYVAIKDAGGTIREYLYPSASAVQGVTLVLQENADANGVWHIQNPISAGGSNTTLYQTTTFNPGGTPDALTVIQVTATQYVFLSWLSGYNNNASLRATLGTINLSTKAWTFGSTTTLVTNSGTARFQSIGGDSNGVDRGIIGAWIGTVNVANTGSWQAWGFAIVAGTLYFSGSTSVWSLGGTTNIQNFGGTWYAGADNAFLYYGSNYNSVYNAILTAFKVNVTSTTVTLAQCTGSLSYADGGGPYWLFCPTSKTTCVIDRSNATSPSYATYNSSTNVMSGGSRTTQTTQIVGNLMSNFGSGNGQNIILTNSTGTKLFLNNASTTCFTIANPGTASVTVATGATYNYKAFPSKSYSTQSTAVGFNSYYVVSSTSYQVLAGNNLLNCDPTNANFNFNTASFSPGSGAFYWTSATQIVAINLLSTTQILSNVINAASPFIS